MENGLHWCREGGASGLGLVAQPLNNGLVYIGRLGGVGTVRAVQAFR